MRGLPGHDGRMIRNSSIIGWTRRLRETAVRGLRGGRWNLLLLFTALCLVVREEFPFSNFPMYSSFGKSTYYVYLASSEGAAFATLPIAGMTTPTLKKMYEAEVKKEVRRLRSSRSKLTLEQKRPAGERILARLKNSPRAQEQGTAFPEILRLYEVNIALDGVRFDTRTDLIAEIR